MNISPWPWPVPTVAEIDAELSRRQTAIFGTSLAKVLANDPDDLPELTRLAERLEPALRREFLEAVNSLRGEIDLEDLARAVATGQATVIEVATRLDELASRLNGLVPVLRRGFLEGAGYANQQLERAGFPVRFDLIQPHAVQWVEQAGANLVTNITDVTRQAIRDQVAASVAGQQDVRQTARAIRDILGLTPQQAAAVEAFRERLIAEGVPFEDLMRRAERVAEGYRRQRAMTVARTEILTAENAGQMALWREARAQGLLTETTRRVWIATPDDRVDPECEALDGQETGIEEPFPGGAMQPPLHPRCRCAMGLVFG